MGRIFLKQCYCMTSKLLFLLVSVNQWCSYVQGDTTVPGGRPGQVASLGKQNYKTAFCLTHIATNEIYLHCGEHRLVNLLTAYYGVQDIPMDDNPVCSYQESNACLEPLSEMGPLRSRCMGQSECRFPVGILYLSACRQESNFVQVEYECIPGNSASFGSVVDICGDLLGGQAISREAGYITSVNYPATYPPNEMCTCNITAKSQGAHIILYTLDVDMFSTLYYQRGQDWLEYTESIDKWGSGRLVDNSLSAKAVSTKMDKIQLNFRSDGINEARGFWLRYEALFADGKPSDIELSCGKYSPKDYRSSIVCFNDNQPKEEMYLNCHYMGVINILYAEHGYYDKMGKCTTIHQRQCTRSAMGYYGMLASCMGQSECTFTVPKETIPSCSHDSNYFQVHYQCVSDQNDPVNIIDICGDEQQGTPVTKDIGYIESLNYPQIYSSNTRCQCTLEVKEPESEVIITVLDMKIAAAKHGPVCENDWIEFTRSDQTSGHGQKLCSQPSREPIYTDTNKVSLNFHTDNQNEDRGFWLKYYGRKSDGSRVPVTVSCLNLGTPYQPVNVVTENIPNDSPSSGKTRKPDLMDGDPGLSVVKSVNKPLHTDSDVIFGLMVGLGVVAVLIFLVLVGMIIYKYKRNKGGCTKKSHEEGVVSVSADRNMRMDPGYGSTFHSPYNTLDNESNPGSSISKQSIRSKVSSGLPGPYGGTIEPEYGTYIPEPDYNMDDEVNTHPSSGSKRPHISVTGKRAFSYKNPVFHDDGDGLGRVNHAYKT